MSTVTSKSVVPPLKPIKSLLYIIDGEKVEFPLQGERLGIQLTSVFKCLMKEKMDRKFKGNF